MKKIFKSLGVALSVSAIALASVVCAFATDYPVPGKYNDATVDEPASSEEVILLGDVNGDKTVDVTDVTYLQLYVAEQYEFSPAQEAAGDVNVDGIVDITDSTLVQLMIAGRYPTNN